MSLYFAYQECTPHLAHLSGTCHIEATCRLQDNNEAYKDKGVPNERLIQL